MQEHTAAPRRGQRRSWTTLLATSAAIALTWGGFVPLGSALADTAPTNPSSPSTPETVSTDVLPTPQIGDGLTSAKNDTKGAGVVWDQVVIGNTVYVGGAFSFARPSGAAAGEQVVPRGNLLAYDLSTGALLPFAPVFDAQVRTLAASPDGKRLYVGGTFTKVDGIARYRIAAFDVATGALTGFAPTVDSTVTTLLATDSTLYAGGYFTTAQKTARARFAAFDTNNGALRPWAPSAVGGDPLAMTISPAKDKLVLAGSFTSLNGSSDPGYGMGAVDATTGASLPWKVNRSIRNAGINSRIMSLASDGTSVYGTGNMSNKNLEGTESVFKASWADGTLEWHSDCHGDTYSVAVVGPVVYNVGHAHYCGGIGGFGEGVKSVTSDQYHRALAFSTATTGTLKPWTTGGSYGDFGGRPSPSLLNWYPDLAAGDFTGSFQSAWDVTSAKGYVLLAGEFTSVNGVKQRGITRFAPKSIAPNKDKPQLEGAAMNPTVTNFGNSYVKLSWTANYDRDNSRLTYQVIRNGDMSKPVFETTAESTFFQRPKLNAVDGYLTPGKTYEYRIRTIDPFGNARWSDTVTYTAPATSTWTDGMLSPYDKSVLQAQPSGYWSMNEPTGTVANDWVAGNAQSAVAQPRGVGIEGTSAARSATLSGTAFSAEQSAKAAPIVFSTESWVKTGSTAGGQVLGFGSDRNALSSTQDRTVRLTADGRITYTLGTSQKIESTPGHNDGAWHHVVTTTGPAGSQLYVDGTLAASSAAMITGSTYANNGYWKIGGPAESGGLSLTGSVDNVAVYPRVLTASEVSAHVEAITPKAVNKAPVASFTAAASGLAVAVNGSASSDSDGSVASYAWTFGDGGTATGATATRTYAAAGTYTVTLTVTDDDGATHAVTKQVTVSGPVAPPVSGVIAKDAFDRSVASGWGTAATGGAWTIGGGSAGASVTAGAGLAVTAKGQTRSMALSGATSTSSDTTFSFTVDQAPTAGGQYVAAVGRQVGAENYNGRVWVQSNGVLQVQLRRGDTILKTVNLAATYTPGDTVHVRFQVAGSGTTTLGISAWTTGTQPASWNLTTTDTTASLQAAGSVGLGTYVSASAAAASTTFSFRDYAVTTVG
jgi:PKD repeat protein